jgi:hypothetical protein
MLQRVRWDLRWLQRRQPTLTIVESKPPRTNQVAAMVRPHQDGVYDIYDVLCHLDKNPVEIGLHVTYRTCIAV